MKYRSKKPQKQPQGGFALNFDRIVGIAGLIGLIVGAWALLAALEANRLSIEANNIALTQSEASNISATQATAKLGVHVVSRQSMVFDSVGGIAICHYKIRIINSGASPALITSFITHITHNQYGVQLDSWTNTASGEALVVQGDLHPIPILRAATFLVNGDQPSILDSNIERVRQRLIDFPARIDAKSHIDMWAETQFQLEKKTDADQRFGVTTTIYNGVGDYPFTYDFSDEVSPIEIYYVFLLSDELDANVEFTNESVLSTATDAQICGYMPSYDYVSNITNPTP